MTTSAAEGTDTFGGTTVNEYSQNNTPTLRIIAKNTRGLKSDDRIYELINELNQTKTWDIVILNETWRVDECETFATNEGHLFANADCEAGRHGVGFLVHGDGSNLCSLSRRSAREWQL